VANGVSEADPHLLLHRKSQLILAVLISCSRFGAAFGLALVTIIRESVADVERSAMSSASSEDFAMSPDWPQEQEALWKGIQAAFYFCAGCGFAGGFIRAPRIATARCKG